MDNFHDINPPMGKTLDVAKDRLSDQTKTVLPAEVARGVYIQNAPSLRALKLMHMMISIAGHRMAEDVRHEMRLSDIRRVDGMAHHDKESLKPLFAELRATVLTYDEPNAKRYVIGGILDHAEVDYRHEDSGEVLVSWYFGRMFRDMAEESQRWALLDRQTVFHLGSKYSVLLFQHIASLTGLGKINSKTFTIPELRAVFSIPEGKIQRFADLNKDILTPSISEINNLSRINLSATAHKIGRTIVSVEIQWSLKESPRLPEKPVEGVAKTAEAAGQDFIFPASGGVRYLPHWRAVKHDAGCNMDDDMIADRFRYWCEEKRISLKSPKIKQAFSDYCRKVGKV